MRLSTRVLVLILPCLLPSGPAPAQAPVVIENPRPIWKVGEALLLASRPSMVIGTQDGEPYQLSRVAGAARLADGRIVVADGLSRTLRFFGPTGTFLTSVGGPGEGPGDFETLISFFALPGDTLVAGSIIGNGELSYFNGKGEFLKRIALRGDLTGPPTETPMVLAPLDGAGRRLIGVMPRRSPYQRGDRWVDSFPVKIVDAKNAQIQMLGVMASMEKVIDDGQPHTPWFSATAAFASDGRRIFLGYGSEYAIRVYSAHGQLERVIRRAWTPTRVTEADIESFVVEWGKRWITSSGAEAEAERKAMRKAPYAMTVPAFSQFLPDRTGRLWVREAHVADAAGAGALNRMPMVASRWSLFDPTGRWLGDVTMPAKFWPTDIGADYVLGIALDDDEVPTVVMYRLGRAAGI